jgi:catechol 2,3-dioxygenase-like lactoylglutathione lyase family enzyme
LRIDHVHLEVDDLEAAVLFYRDRLGFRLEVHEPATAIFEVGDGTAIVVDLARPPRPPAERGRARGVTVAIHAEPVDRKYTELRARGMENVPPPEDRAWGDRSFLVHDPEGYTFEFTEPLPPRRA